MPALDAVLIGAGNRGRFTYGAYARAHPENLRIEFEGGVTASFGVHGHATHERRTIRVTGSEGELRGVFQESHLLGFPTEQARLEACVVEMASFRDIAARPEG